MEKMADFLLFWKIKITADSDCGHETKKRLRQKKVDQPKHIMKTLLADKGHIRSKLWFQ